MHLVAYQVVGRCQSTAIQCLFWDYGLRLMGLWTQAYGTMDSGLWDYGLRLMGLWTQAYGTMDLGLCDYGLSLIHYTKYVSAKPILFLTSLFVCLKTFVVKSEQ